MQSAYRKLFISLNEIWLAMSLFTGNLQPLNKFLWIFLVINVSKLDKKCRKLVKFPFMSPSKIRLLVPRFHKSECNSNINTRYEDKEKENWNVLVENNLHFTERGTDNG
jgi:hypothetical protein